MHASRYLAVSWAYFAALQGSAKAAKTPSPNDGPPYLNTLAQQKGKLWFGTAVDIPGPELNDKGYMTLFNDSRLFGQVTPGNYQKFEFTEPQQGVFNYTGGTLVIDLAKASGKYVRCHNLIWYAELPTWLTSQTWTNASLISIMQTHITHLVEHWAADCYSWDVVNEALRPNGSFASNIWYDTIGAAYVPLAFQFAAEAVAATGKDIKLYYNDYGIELPGPKQAGAVSLVQDLQARGIRIDGVGLESHFEVGLTPTAPKQVAAMQSFTALGLDVAVTELDVRFYYTGQNSTFGYSKQALNYYNTVSACMQVPRCKGVTVWDFDDKYSWVTYTFPGPGLADIYFANLTRKPAYTACIEAIQGVNCSVCATPALRILLSPFLLAREPPAHLVYLEFALGPLNASTLELPQLLLVPVNAWWTARGWLGAEPDESFAFSSALAPSVALVDAAILHVRFDAVSA